MADLNQRLPQNVPGNYFVSCDCTDCGLCPAIAPTVFNRIDELGLSVVFHQPETEAERQNAEEALAGCPTEAIGNNG